MKIPTQQIIAILPIEVGINEFIETASINS
jgi:hypothetical protein